MRQRSHEHVNRILLALKHWCNRARDEPRQRTHKWPVQLDLNEVPPLEVLEANIFLDPPPDRVLDDDERDEQEGRVVAQAKAKPGARPGPKPKAKGKAKGKAQAKAIAEPVGAPERPAIAAFSSSGSSSSSSTSTSSSSSAADSE